MSEGTEILFTGIAVEKRMHRHAINNTSDIFSRANLNNNITETCISIYKKKNPSNSKICSYVSLTIAFSFSAISGLMLHFYNNFHFSIYDNASHSE